MISDNGLGVVPTRDTGEGLRRIVTMTGAYEFRNLTVKHIRDLKGKRQLTETLPFYEEEAAAAAEAGIDMLNVRYDPRAPELAISIRKAAPHTFMSFVIPLMSVTSEKEALKVAFSAMECGADSIMCQCSLDFVSVMARSGVPVQGHVGLVPRKSTWTGGLRSVGKTVNEAIDIFHSIKKLEDAGAWAVECEVIPALVMKELSKRTSLVTISIGSGGGADVQFLFAQDILGDGNPPFPRHSKQYCNLNVLREKMQKMRIEAFREYISDVAAGKFPSSAYEVEVDQKMISKMIKIIES